MKGTSFVGSVVVFAVLAACNGAIDERSYYVLVEDARRLERGAPVYVSGVESGSVREVSLTPQGPRIELVVSPAAAEWIRRGACVSIEPHGMTGEMRLMVEPGARSEPLLRENERIECFREDDAMERMDEVMTALVALLVEIRTGDGVIGHLLTDEDLVTQLESFLERNGGAPTETPSEAEGESSPE